MISLTSWQKVKVEEEEKHRDHLGETFMVIKIKFGRIVAIEMVKRVELGDIFYKST
jgi:hypothetical protein